jgi:hypothetical protein
VHLLRERRDVVLSRSDVLAARLGDHVLGHVVVERAAAHAVARLEHAHLVARHRELARGGQAGQSGADDGHFHAALLARGVALGRGAGAGQCERGAGGCAGTEELPTGQRAVHVY